MNPDVVVPLPQIISPPSSRRQIRRLFCVVLAALVAPTLAGQTIVIDSPTFDAGTVHSGTPITTEFVVKNSGSTPLRISDVKPACGCMKAKFDKAISPGGAGKIVLVIDTSSFQSAISKSAVVYSNDAAKRELSLIVIANVRGLVSMQPPGSLRIETTKGQLGLVEAALVSEHPTFKPVIANTTEPYLRAVLLPENEPGKWKLMVTSESTAPVGPLAAKVKVQTGIPEQPEYYVVVSGLIRNSVGAGAATPPKPSEPTLTNDEVLKLVAADLGDEIVIAKVKNAATASLDVSTEALLSLKEKKISEAVITAMIERASAPDKTAGAAPATTAAASPNAPVAPCAGIELMGLYKNEIFDRAMGGGVVEWLAKIRNSTVVTKIVVFGWRDSEGRQRKSQVQIAGGEIASPRLDLTQARFIAPVANLELMSCE